MTGVQTCALPILQIEWADEKSPVVRPKGPNGRLGSPENTKTIAITDEDGIFDFTLRNAGYNCFGLMPPGIPSGRYKDGKEIKEWFASTLIIDVPASAAGGSASAVIPVKPKLPEAVSKDERLQSVATQPFSEGDVIPPIIVKLLVWAALVLFVYVVQHVLKLLLLL